MLLLGIAGLVARAVSGIGGRCWLLILALTVAEKGELNHTSHGTSDHREEQGFQWRRDPGQVRY